MRGFGGVLAGDAMAQREEGEERAGQQFQRAKDDPAGAGAEQRDPPRRPRGAPVARQESQEVDLLADLRHQREHHRGGGAEQQEIEMADGSPCSPANLRHSVNECGLAQAIAAKGRMCRMIQSGCVHSWKRLISVMP